ncbi:AAA family ATPase [Patescibacteria group bacterium]|nr:AAA family ATPase [Patescibacteria group bacterium]
MYLKSLEVNGFKSFAKKSDLEFSTAITAIVGPNGSGKSNTAEAFRFVLGEQSLKSMRGKRGEDMIFNGSTSVSRSNRASVKITLDNTAKHFPIDFDEITIERTVYRDGTNEYALNGGKTRLKDVQELLASANIGSTGHHIISQGEADRILTSSARERREMIEDALGLKVFQYKKAESERKLEKTTANIAQVESLRREVTPHLRFLERQVKKIEKSLEVRDELTKMYVEYLKREDEYLAFNQDRLSEALCAPRAELARLETELASANAKLAAAEKDEKRDALVLIEGQLRTVRDERQQRAREIGKLEGQISYLERRIAEAERRRGETVARPAITYERVEYAISSAENLADQARGEVNVEVLQRLITNIVSVLRSFLNEAGSTNESSVPENNDSEERDTLVAQKKELDESLLGLDKEEEMLRLDYESLKISIEAELSESREAEREVFRIMAREQELTQLISRTERDQELVERDRNEFKRELEEAVALIGRSVTDYFSHVVVDSMGEPLTREMIAQEDRSHQIERRRLLEKMKIRLEELGAGAADDILKEYAEAKERDEFLAREIADLETSVASLQSLITELSAELNNRFKDGIDKIAEEFTKFFILMFGGGTASLRRIKPKEVKKKDTDTDMAHVLASNGEEEVDESIEEGIEIDVSLPNKRVRGLEMLSGGERALTSIALIFAMSQVNPPPFVILDETDAALDEANSKRYGDMIEALSKRSQLILITHNRETMSRAGVLYGITMGGDGVSKILSVKFDEAVEVAK